MKRTLFGILFVLATSTTWAQTTPPTIGRVSPMVLRPGEKTPVEITGTELAGASAIVFDDARIAPIPPEKTEGGSIHAGIEIPASVTGQAVSFRVVTPRGISNAIPLGIGRSLPVEKEKEPNDGFKTAQVVPLGGAVHGEINQGNDVDLYAVDAKRGATLVAEVLAARVGADLDALVTLFSPDGRELASDDDRFGRDSAVWAALPEEGRYIVQIQDANGQVNNAANPNPNRHYVMNIGTFPVVTSVFPPGGRRGGSGLLHLDGANLPENEGFRWEIPADVPLGDVAIRPEVPRGLTNPIALRIGAAAEFDEPLVEPADDPLHATIVTVPGSINGRFQRLDDGDVDLFRLKAEPGHEGDFAITALAAKVGSMADPVLSVIDEKGASQAEDDDTLGRDAYVERRIDSDSGIVVGVRDAFRRGGDRFVYRIEVTPLPEVVVTADLTVRNISRDGTRAIPLTFARHGFDGPFTVEASSLPEGVSAATVSAAEKSKDALMILRAAQVATLGGFSLSLKTVGIPGPGAVEFREQAVAGGKLVATGSPLLCIAEPASLGVSAPPELNLPRGGEMPWRLTFERRGDAGKKGIKLRVVASEGDLDGIEVAKEASINAEANEAVFTFKAKADAAPRRATVAVRAWFDGMPEANGVDAATTIVVPE